MRNVGRICVLAMLVWAVGTGCKDVPADATARPPEPLTEHRYLDLEFIREFTLVNDHTMVTVPWDKVWLIEGHMPAEGRVTTDDILFQGWVELGECYLEGDFWLTLSDPQTQPIWVRGGTRIGLGDTRRELTVREFQNNTPDE
jgi:hypothetical protein